MGMGGGGGRNLSFRVGNSRSSTKYCSCVHSTPNTYMYMYTFIHHSAVIPGDYGFRVTFKSTSAAYSYTEQTKTLCVNRGVDFAAIFSFTTPPKPGLSVRTLVCTKNAEDFHKVGIVKTCALHKDKSKSYESASVYNVQMYMHVYCTCTCICICISNSQDC